MVGFAEPPCEDCEFFRDFGIADRCGRCARAEAPKKEPAPEFIPFPKVYRNRGHAEQLGKYGGPGSRKFEKRRANRLRRRAERVDPENAPSRLIRGWND